MSTVVFKIRRQNDPDDMPYWEEFVVDHYNGMTVVQALALISKNPVTSEGNQTTPIVFDVSCYGGQCGACAMIINDRPRLACHTLVDDLDEPITLEPLSKFPIIKDLAIDRSGMFEALVHAKAWVDVDDIHSDGPPLRMDPKLVANAGCFALCVMCGACAEACPQVNERSFFKGAFLFAVMLPLMDHPIGRFGADERLDIIAERGGIADCAKAQNCESVCPQGIPLTGAIARLEWRSTNRVIKCFLRE